MTLKERIASKQTDQTFDRLMSSGKFQDTGKLYSPDQARQDSTNESLRLRAQLNGKTLDWSK